jgi:hypothetical protein
LRSARSVPIRETNVPGGHTDKSRQTLGDNASLKVPVAQRSQTRSDVEVGATTSPCPRSQVWISLHSGSAELSRNSCVKQSSTFGRHVVSLKTHSLATNSSTPHEEHGRHVVSWVRLHGDTWYSLSPHLEHVRHSRSRLKRGGDAAYLSRLY